MSSENVAHLFRVLFHLTLAIARTHLTRALCLRRISRSCREPVARMMNDAQLHIISNAAAATDEEVFCTRTSSGNHSDSMTSFWHPPSARVAYVHFPAEEGEILSVLAASSARLPSTGTAESEA